MRSCRWRVSTRFLVGPYDLSASMGTPGQIHTAEFQRAVVDRVAAVGPPDRHGHGHFRGDPREPSRPYIDRGFRLLAVGTDTLLLGTAAKQLLDPNSKKTAVPVDLRFGN